MSIIVLKPGLLSTFQDLGRRDNLHLGVPLNGVMDERAHRIANWLVGNSAEEATLEITLLGPSLQFEQPSIIALSGADLSATLDGKPAVPNVSLTVATGSVLTFGTRKNGIRAYLAVQGGYGLNPVMGSVSTNIRASYGGLEGKPLWRGAKIPLKRPAGTTLRHLSRTIPDFNAEIIRSSDAPLRVVPGREHDTFSAESIKTFGSETYRILPQSDRMGYRLEGSTLKRTVKTDMFSESVTAGSVQVPPDGHPIVLMADCQTTGGYPRIAHLAWVDLPNMAQRAPGGSLRFEWIELEEAQRLAIHQARIFKEMEHEVVT